jgi:putative component of toxin-antitoxin plasmid stabilization module
MKEIKVYTKENGKQPFFEWFNALDNSIRMLVSKRMERIINGNLGNYKKIDSEISELKFTIGTG